MSQPHHRIGSLSDFLSQSRAKFNGSKISAVGQDITNIDLLSQSLALKIRVLFLSDNRIDTISNISQFENLEVVSIANNSLKYLDQLQPLSNLRHLKKLSLEGNEVTKTPYYTETVLNLCPQLTTLDGIQVSSSYVSSKVKQNYAKSKVLYQQAIQNELRNCILQHVVIKIYCHHELNHSISRKFRHFLGAHVPNSGLDVIPRSSDSVLRIACRGGVFRWLQLMAAPQFARQVESNIYKRSVLHSSSRKLRHSNWDSLLDEYLSYQQKMYMALVEQCILTTTPGLVKPAPVNRFENRTNSHNMAVSNDGVSEIETGLNNRGLLSSTNPKPLLSVIENIQFIGTVSSSSEPFPEDIALEEILDEVNSHGGSYGCFDMHCGSHDSSVDTSLVYSAEVTSRSLGTYKKAHTTPNNKGDKTGDPELPPRKQTDPNHTPVQERLYTRMQTSAQMMVHHQSAVQNRYRALLDNMHSDEKSTNNRFCVVVASGSSNRDSKSPTRAPRRVHFDLSQNSCRKISPVSTPSDTELSYYNTPAPPCILQHHDDSKRSLLPHAPLTMTESSSSNILGGLPSQKENRSIAPLAPATHSTPVVSENFLLNVEPNENKTHVDNVSRRSNNDDNIKNNNNNNTKVEPICLDAVEVSDFLDAILDLQKPTDGLTISSESSLSGNLQALLRVDSRSQPYVQVDSSGADNKLFDRCDDSMPIAAEQEAMLLLSERQWRTLHSEMQHQVISRVTSCNDVQSPIANDVLASIVNGGFTYSTPLDGSKIIPPPPPPPPNFERVIAATSMPALKAQVARLSSDYVLAVRNTISSCTSSKVLQALCAELEASLTQIADACRQELIDGRNLLASIGDDLTFARQLMDREGNTVIDHVTDMEQRVKDWGSRVEIARADLERVANLQFEERQSRNNLDESLNEVEEAAGAIAHEVETSEEINSLIKYCSLHHRLSQFMRRSISLKPNIRYIFTLFRRRVLRQRRIRNFHKLKTDCRNSNRKSVCFVFWKRFHQVFQRGITLARWHTSHLKQCTWREWGRAISKEKRRRRHTANVLFMQKRLAVKRWQDFLSFKRRELADGIQNAIYVKLYIATRIFRAWKNLSTAGLRYLKLLGVQAKTKLATRVVSKWWNLWRTNWSYRNAHSNAAMYTATMVFNKRLLCRYYNAFAKLMMRVEKARQIVCLKRSFSLLRCRLSEARQFRAVQSLTEAASNLLLLRNPFKQLRHYRRQRCLYRWAAACIKKSKLSRHWDKYRHVFISTRAIKASESRAERDCSRELYPVVFELRRNRVKNLISRCFGYWRYLFLSSRWVYGELGSGCQKKTSVAVRADDSQQQITCAKSSVSPVPPLTVAILQLLSKNVGAMTNNVKADSTFLSRYLMTETDTEDGQYDESSEGTASCGDSNEEDSVGSQLEATSEKDKRHAPQEVLNGSKQMFGWVRVRTALKRWADFRTYTLWLQAQANKVVKTVRFMKIRRCFNCIVGIWLSQLVSTIRSSNSDGKKPLMESGEYVGFDVDASDHFKSSHTVDMTNGNSAYDATFVTETSPIVNCETSNRNQLRKDLLREAAKQEVLDEELLSMGEQVTTAVDDFERVELATADMVASLTALDGERGVAQQLLQQLRDECEVILMLQNEDEGGGERSDYSTIHSSGPLINVSEICHSVDSTRDTYLRKKLLCFDDMEQFYRQAVTAQETAVKENKRSMSAITIAEREIVLCAEETKRLDHELAKLAEVRRTAQSTAKALTSELQEGLELAEQRVSKSSPYVYIYFGVINF